MKGYITIKRDLFEQEFDRIVDYFGEFRHVESSSYHKSNDLIRLQVEHQDIQEGAEHRLYFKNGFLKLATKLTTADMMIP